MNISLFLEGELESLPAMPTNGERPILGFFPNLPIAMTVLLLAVTGYAQGRPDILSVPPATLPEREEGLSKQEMVKMFSAELQMVSKLVEMYPGRNLVFFARDAEGLADMAKLYLEQTGRTNEVDRIKIAEASRLTTSFMLGSEYAAKMVPAYTKYYEQLGVTQESVQNNRVLFIDTGYVGSVPLHAMEILGVPEAVAARQIHLIMGVTNPGRDHLLETRPNSRVFMNEVQPGLGSANYWGNASTTMTDPSFRQQDKIDVVDRYAKLFKFNFRAAAYSLDAEGRAHVVYDSKAYGGSDMEAERQGNDEVNRKKAVEEMAFRRYWAEQNREAIRESMSFWQKTSEAFHSGRKAGVVSHVKGELERAAAEPERSRMESRVRDFIEMTDTSLEKKGLVYEAKDFGLEARQSHMDQNRAQEKGPCQALLSH